LDAQIIKNLRKEIQRHDRLYYGKAQPEITDFEYDQLVKKLEALESLHPELITQDSPTQRVSNDLTKTFNKIKHSQKMLSISNTYSSEELFAFDKRVHELLPDELIEYVVELKIDGVAVALKYENGSLVAAITRGDGEVGDDITANARTIRSLPLSITYSGTLELRGEAFIDQKTFQIINDRLPENEKLQNPRNATAGTLKLLNPKLVAERGVRFWTHFVIGTDWQDSHYNNLERIHGLGFPVNPHTKMFSSIEQVIEHCAIWGKKRFDLDYETDGMVIKVNAIKQQKKLGATAKSPRWVIAYKYKPESACTRLLAIDHQVGRTGVITPVARLKPVALSGTTVSNATLHNYDEITKLDIRIGDLVYVEKGGEIIPKITGVDKINRPADAQPAAPPLRCPECNEPLIKNKGEVALRCDNLSCPAQMQRSIEHFVSRNAMNIENIGSSLIEQLLHERLITDWSDLYSLHYTQLATLDRMGNKSAANVIQAIEKSKNSPLDKLIHALGIRHVGAGAARTLAAHISDLEELGEKTEEELAAIHEIGPVIAKSIFQWYHNDNNGNRLKKLKAAGVIFNNKENLLTTAQGSPLSGKTFVITGTLEKISRTDAESLVREYGGKAVSSVSNKTDYVVYGKDTGSKLEKAEKLGIPVLNEQEFFHLLDRA
jgi:DNA ligase (NAD+)